MSLRVNVRLHGDGSGPEPQQDAGNVRQARDRFVQP
jgi:hypothetical protein